VESLVPAAKARRIVLVIGMSRRTGRSGNLDADWELVAPVGGGAVAVACAIEDDEVSASKAGTASAINGRAVILAPKRKKGRLRSGHCGSAKQTSPQKSSS